MTLLDGQPICGMGDIVEEKHPMAHISVGYLLVLMIKHNALDCSQEVERPVCTYVTDSVRVFTFELRGAVFIYKVEIIE